MSDPDYLDTLEAFLADMAPDDRRALLEEARRQVEERTAIKLAIESEYSGLEPARVLYVDDPWLFGDALPGGGRGAVKHYPCMPLADLVRFPLPPLADDCVLAMWRVASMQAEALALVHARGFPPPQAEIVWIKTVEGTKPTKRTRMGMGRMTRAVHEVCLISRRGKLDVKAHDEVSAVFAPRGEHSAKPEAVAEKLERLFPGPYVELFARRQRPGWTCLGLEALERLPKR